MNKKELLIRALQENLADHDQILQRILRPEVQKECKTDKIIYIKNIECREALPRKKSSWITAGGRMRFAAGCILAAALVFTGALGSWYFLKKHQTYPVETADIQEKYLADKAGKNNAILRALQQIDTILETTSLLESGTAEIRERQTTYKGIAGGNQRETIQSQSSTEEVIKFQKKKYSFDYDYTQSIDGKIVVRERKVDENRQIQKDGEGDWRQLLHNEESLYPIPVAPFSTSTNGMQAMVEQHLSGYRSAIESVQTRKDAEDNIIYKFQIRTDTMTGWIEFIVNTDAQITDINYERESTEILDREKNSCITSVLAGSVNIRAESVVIEKLNPDARQRLGLFGGYDLNGTGGEDQIEYGNDSHGSGYVTFWFADGTASSYGGLQESLIEANQENVFLKDLFGKGNPSVIALIRVQGYSRGGQLFLFHPRKGIWDVNYLMGDTPYGDGAVYQIEEREKYLYEIQLQQGDAIIAVASLDIRNQVNYNSEEYEAAYAENAVSASVDSAIVKLEFTERLDGGYNIRYYQAVTLSDQIGYIVTELQYSENGDYTYVSSTFDATDAVYSAF